MVPSTSLEVRMIDNKQVYRCNKCKIISNNNKCPKCGIKLTKQDFIITKGESIWNQQTYVQQKMY